MISFGWKGMEMTSDVNSKSVTEADGFAKVQEAEIARINAYRGANGRKKLSPNIPSKGPIDITGVALSGGGIRSAAFCLGVLQAFDSNIGVEKVDCLSTVSGGGYIGLSLTAGMNAIGESSPRRFPFTTDKDDRRDNLPVGHIRNYANYLIPRGFRDVLDDVTVTLRGISANIAMVFGAILVIAAITLFANGDLFPQKLADTKIDTSWFAGFLWTKITIVLGIFLQVCWAIWRSIKMGGPEFTGNFFNVSRLWLVLAAIVAFCELQPLALRGLRGGVGDMGTLANYISVIPVYLAPFAAIVAFTSKYLGDAIKSQESQKGWVAISKWIVSKGILAIAALALPITLWIVYLEMTLQGYKLYRNWPEWMRMGLEYFISGSAREFLSSYQPPYPMASIFAVFGTVVFAACYIFLLPNANSLHRLYRDRLSKTFLFDPKPIVKLNLDDGETIEPPHLDSLKMSELEKIFTPVHISNAALNIQGSRYANMRGRNADFFFFSQDYCGSSATGFIKTEVLEQAVPDLDIATIMAVSGAAASSNMGSSTVWGFAPTLALLNIRLGYWMKNPRFVNGGHGKRAKSLMIPYLLLEMFSSLNEESDQIYLTDGGHIENLGLYELLRRRCKRIIVVDAEADPGLSFPSLQAVERHARINLGIRIDLPWWAIHDASIAVDEAFAKSHKPDNSRLAEHPHVAIGTIDYGTTEKGILIYIKSSLTGDENDYVLDYKKRYSAFPHETTGDQFFSEEQFEVYRALGFHAAHGAFTGKNYVEGMANLPGVIEPKRGSKKTRSAVPPRLKQLFNQV